MSPAKSKTSTVSATAVDATRRGLLTSVAGAAASAAVCGAAPAFATEADPVYAAIEAHRVAYAFHEECIKQGGEIQQAVFDRLREYDDLPEAEKDAAARSMLAIFQQPHGPHAATRPDMTLAEAREFTDAMAHKVITDENGMAEANKLLHAGCDADQKAFNALVATVPTTKAGVSALIQYVLARVKTDGVDFLLSGDADGPSIGEALLCSINASLSTQA